MNHMLFSKESKISFIGSGTVGKTLAIALYNLGYPVAGASSRTFASAEDLASCVPGCVAYREADEAAAVANVVFITTPDDAIRLVAKETIWHHGQGVIHCSGAASLEELEPAREAGVVPGAIHPLQTFSSVSDALTALPGSTFGIEGGNEISKYLKQLAIDLGGNPIFLQAQDKPLYHATVVMMGGLLTALAGAVADSWAHFGIERQQALNSLAPIVKGDAETLVSVGVPRAIAGPLPRGDVGTVQKHITAMQSQAPVLLAAYCHMALAGLPYATAKGNLAPETVTAIREKLYEALNSLQ